jgi:hypothetical protein
VTSDTPGARLTTKRVTRSSRGPSACRSDASGGTQTERADHLSLVDQIAVCAAGYVAENVFGHPLHRLAASDHNRIRELLEANGVEEGPKAEALRSESAGCARERLLAHKTKVIRLAERLVRDGYAAEVLRLMEEDES